MFRPLPVLALLCILIPGISLPLSQPHASGYENEAVLPIASSHPPLQGDETGKSEVPPLPGGCGKRSPIGGDEPTCCINGLVYLESEALSGATVQIENQRGDSIATLTQEYGGIESRPYYRVSLSAPPLSVSVGELVTITVIYVGRIYHMPHLVLPGSQQVDVVIARDQPYDYVIERQSAGVSEHLGDITRNSQGNIYVLDRQNYRIRVLDENLTPQDDWSVRTSGDGKAIEPISITTDESGTLYLLDAANQRIERYRSDGTQPGAPWGGVGDNAGQFNFSSNSSIAVAPDGSLYITDSNNNRVQHLSATGEYLGQWGSTGNAVGQFDAPGDLVVGRTGQVFVADTNNARIQAFNANGTPMTTWTVERFSANLAIDDQDRIYTGDAIFSPTGEQLGQGYQWQAALDVDASGTVYCIFETPQMDFVVVYRPMAYTRPVATIVYVSGISIGAEQTLTMQGMGQDSDETPVIRAYRWTSNLDGVIGTKAILEIPAHDLSQGTHIITLDVQDNEGEWSLATSETIHIAGPSKAAWTMLLYLAGDYHNDDSLLRAFNRALGRLQQELSPSVQVAAMIDGPQVDDTHRLLLIPQSKGGPPQMSRLPLGEQAMDNPETLSNFIRWGQTSLPADHYYLSIANHGQGSRGMAWDTTSDLQDGVVRDDAYLSVKELGQALSADGVAPIDVLHLDSCSLDMLEIAYEVHQRTSIVVASQYLGWGYFAYDDYQVAMGKSSTPGGVAQAITRRYARLAERDHYPYTIAALNMEHAEPTLIALDRLASALVARLPDDPELGATLDAIWETSQKLDSDGDSLNSELDVFLDLQNWGERLRTTVDDAEIQERAADLLAELSGNDPFILANEAQSSALPREYARGAFIDLSGASGVSVFFPRSANSAVFYNYVNNQVYSFTANAHWPEFLRDHLIPSAGEYLQHDHHLPALEPFIPHRFTPTANMGWSETQSSHSLPGPLISLDPQPGIETTPLLEIIVEEGHATEATLEIHNTSADNLSYTIQVNPANSWLIPSTTSGTVAVGEVETIPVMLPTDTLPPGLHTGSISVTHTTAGAPVETPVLVEIVTVQTSPTTITYDLRAGWNALAPTVLTSTVLIEEVLRPISGSYDGVCIYPHMHWLCSIPSIGWLQGKVGSTTAMWVHSTEPATLHLEGVCQSFATVPLHRGWNFTGIPLDQPRSVLEVLAPIAGNYQAIYTFDGGNWKFYAPGLGDGNSLQQIKPGQALWIEMTETGTLPVINSCTP
ncbi:MAG: hypothetical protein HC884_06290 [Chloroflexaceae bacterium]|nr:hypothetical protein [Chloroflexaceae bacterium]